MRVSQLLLPTLKENPTDAETISHRLMLRAGMIRKLASGLYTWLPLGLRVLRKVEGIVREEMNRAGAQEMLMPAVQPAELWKESGRWAHYGAELLRLRDRHNREFCFGPTHEEVITDLIRHEIRSYRQLPANFYQIQVKFRDEVRPRFGIMRAREFLMKDAYSFHIDADSLARTYQVMMDAYCRIFSRIGLDFRMVEADTGAIGGSTSHEFHVLADAGEDAIAFCDRSDYAANVELVSARASSPRAAPATPMQEVATPGVTSVTEVATRLGTTPDRIAKTLIVRGPQGLVALVLRGDHELNPIKAARVLGTGAEFAFASTEEVQAATGAPAGSIGPLGLMIPVIVDASAAELADFVCGTNRAGWHHTGVNWGRDLPEPKIADLRNAVRGDPCPNCPGSLDIRRGIEIGHIFQLGDKYTAALGATCLDQHGHEVVMTMGCYGIGVSRVVAAAIEQNHDERGIIWPAAIAPFDVALVPIGLHKSPKVAEASERLYKDLIAQGLEVLYDDRNERPGVMFSDMDLVGIPQRIVIGDRLLGQDCVEHAVRADKNAMRSVPLAEIGPIVRKTQTAAPG